jgi:Na+-translocating ferredoxin:NAD+ oxidoreductase RnfD subunit
MNHVFYDTLHLTQMLTFHMFHTAATVRQTIIKKNYNTALCNMLQARSVLHTGWLLSLSLTQQPITGSILLQQALDRK